MISCYKVSKQYDGHVIFKDFSYSFPTYGLVLLWGESGCGKTTLLNILAGIIAFDSGEIVYENTKYHKQIDETATTSAYITQDTHFIEYLTVKENLYLCSIDHDAADSLLDKFGLKHIKDDFPKTLSGGERQRLAIIQALLSNKPVLLLDEPTASLDMGNRDQIFETLKILKADHLIIICSHDPEAKNFADEIIDCSNWHLYTDTDQFFVKPIRRIDKKVRESNRPKKLWPFYKKWFSYKGREKSSRYQLLIIFLLSFLLLSVGDTPANKTDSTIHYLYRLNQFRVWTDTINQPLLSNLQNTTSVQEIVLNYNLSVPDGNNGNEAIQSGESVSYDMTCNTIPYKESAFRFSDKIVSGSYFTATDQVIVSAAKARALGGTASIIGETIRLPLYDQVYDMEIVGVFDEFSETEMQYLSASGVYMPQGNNSEIIFLNGAFTQRYINNEKFFMHGNRSYTIYYDSFASMKKSYGELKPQFEDCVFVYADISTKIQFIFEGLFAFLFPLICLATPLSLLFYFQIQNIEWTYNRYLLCHYQYLGYANEEIWNCWLKGCIMEVGKYTTYSLILFFPISLLANLLNKTFMWVPFQIFTLNGGLMLAFLCLIILVSILFAALTFRRIRQKGWYSMLLEQRDLL